MFHIEWVSLVPANLCLDEGQVLGVGGGSSVEELKVDLLISHGTAVLLTEP